MWKISKIWLYYSVFCFFFSNFAHMIKETNRLGRTIIRIGNQTLAFAYPTEVYDEDRDAVTKYVEYEPYTVKSGMSMAANLREAFKENRILLLPNNKVQVLIDTPELLIPLEEYQEEDAEMLYMHTYPSTSHSAIMHHIIPELNCAVVFAVNKDIRTVVVDHYDDVRFMPLMIPVWKHLHQGSHARGNKKLYAYFHDRKMSVFSFSGNRFRFHNTFKVTDVPDAVYFIMYIWQQLAQNHQKDEIYLVGNYDKTDELRQELKRFIHNVFYINPSAEFNRLQVTQIPNVTYDIICLNVEE